VFRKKALQKMIPLLRHQRRDLEAANAELALAATLAEEPKRPFDSGKESRGYRSGQIIFISGVAALVLATVTVVWILCVAILRVKADFNRDVNWLASRLGWAPALLPVSSLALFLGFFPYARSIAAYSNRRDLEATYDSVYWGLLSFHPNYILDVWIRQMFWPLIWCAIVALVGAAFVQWAHWRAHTPQSGLE
jgi:hypothetical protein